MYDVAIVGARCAGSALALLLARSGFRVLLLDRTVFPSDTISSHYIQPSGVACLRRWGLLDRVEATGAPAQHTVTFDFGPFAATGSPAPDADGHFVGYGPRRLVFDPLLAASATEAGAELWDGVSVRAPTLEGRRVTGVTGVTRQGAVLTAHARLVVGADGKRSRIAEAVGAKKHHVRPGTTCMAYSYFSGFDAPHAHLFARHGRFHVVVPTNQDLTLVGVVLPSSKITELRTASDAVFRGAIAEVPWIADRMATARQEERLRAMADLDGYFRTAHGQGWALLGDAGYHRDPITAQGMSDALRQAEWLAQAISAGLDVGGSPELALAEFQRLRDEAFLRMYHLTHDLARLEPPPPDLAARLAVLPGDAGQTSRFLGVIAGTVPVADFFGSTKLAA